MNDTLLILICALLGINLIFLLLLLLRKPADTAGVLREELRASRIENGKEQSNMRQEIATQLDGLGRRSLETTAKISEITASNLENMRLTLDRRLEGMRAENEKSMQEIRRTVDKELSETVSAGLDNSFKSVSTQLEQVYKSMGEMRTMAADISGLKNVLSNVKNRGTWGEVQLGAIMEDILLPTQYETQFSVGEGRERVDFAVKLPGQGSENVYLPIDSKFPMDRYFAVVEAEKLSDPAMLAAAKTDLIKSVTEQAKSIRKKYISPPYTTDFAVLFVPSEGMYSLLAAEDMAYRLQRDEKVLLAGPSTLAALLNSLQMGFRTLAVEKQSANIMKLLSAIKKSFGMFSKNLESTKKSMRAASNNLENAAASSRGILQRLRTVEEADIYEAKALLAEDYPSDDPKDSDPNESTKTEE